MLLLKGLVPAGPQGGRGIIVHQTRDSRIMKYTRKNCHIEAMSELRVLQCVSHLGFHFPCGLDGQGGLAEQCVWTEQAVLPDYL